MRRALPSNRRELRFVGVFAKVLERLGDPRPPMRVGALHGLEILGQQHPAHRQAIVDVLCAYLRMDADHNDPVRVNIQRTLAAHLRPGNPAAFWAGTSLDLAGATLTDLDLSGYYVGGSLILKNAVLLGPARLRGTTVGAMADLRGITCAENAWFERAVFLGPAHFDAATFRADAWLGQVTFAREASFVAADFGGHAWFGGCRFGGPVDFSEAVFRRSVGLRGALAQAPVRLSGTTFVGPARVSRRGEGWNITAAGWRVAVDPDNKAVGSLFWAGHRELQADAQHTPA